MMARRIVSSFVLLLLVNIGIATPSQELLLPVNKRYPTVWLLKNTSDQKVYVDAAVHQGASAGWASVIKPHRYSALLLQRKTFHMLCRQYRDNKLQQVNCHPLLDISVQINRDPHYKIQGEFWLAESRYWLIVWWKLRHYGHWQTWKTANIPRHPDN